MSSTPPRVEGYGIDTGPPEPLSRATELISIVETSIDDRSDITDSILTMMINRPGTDAHIDTITVREPSSGDVVAFGHYLNTEPHVESVTLGWVHPAHMNRGIGTAIVTWGLDRSRSMIPLAPPGTRVTSRCQISDENVPAATLLSTLGYTVDRHEFEMELVFGDQITVTDLPDGVTVRTMTRDEDLGIVADVTTSAFRDHYGWVDSSPEATRERWANYRTMDEWDDDLVWIAEAGKGAVGCLVAMATYGSNTGAGYVGSLGVLRELRGRGLARALLTRSFAEFRRRGMASVVLHVDADSLTGATRLYESVGMRRVHAETAYLTELRPGTDLVKR
ncbi:MAG: GNAT family N-acetyltransferase [Actinomycetia bacterium]|nr:GNAT family N-acetyltransferase [Actinomycetes bacterium]